MTWDRTMTADHRQRLCDEALADLDGITRWEEEAFPPAIAKRKKLGWSSWWVRYTVDTTLVRAIQRLRPLWVATHPHYRLHLTGVRTVLPRRHTLPQVIATITPHTATGTHE